MRRRGGRSFVGDAASVAALRLAEWVAGKVDGVEALEGSEVEDGGKVSDEVVADGEHFQRGQRVQPAHLCQPVVEQREMGQLGERLRGGGGRSAGRCASVGSMRTAPGETGREEAGGCGVREGGREGGRGPEVRASASRP